MMATVSQKRQQAWSCVDASAARCRFKLEILRELRVIDESGNDYLLSTSSFAVINPPKPVRYPMLLRL